MAYGEAMRNAEQWLTEYGASHQNPTNEALHWICVPVILWCVLGFLWITPFPGAVRSAIPAANWATVVCLLAILYYALLSLRLALGILPLLALMLWSLDALSRNAVAPLWLICVTLFVLAWIGQFIGHAIEKKRPSFFKDVQFLMIGPMWLLANLYQRLGVHI
jgi:uncharacterized membrane protein YGL010W